MLLLRVFIVTTLLISSENAVAVRSCRRLPRNNGWFDHVWNIYSDTKFKKTFRVSKATFQFNLGRIEHDLQPSQQYFNYRLSRAKMVIEEAYGELKGRWRVLQRKCESA